VKALDGNPCFEPGTNPLFAQKFEIRSTCLREAASAKAGETRKQYPMMQIQTTKTVELWVSVLNIGAFEFW
jgi:hypothetical protein